MQLLAIQGMHNLNDMVDFGPNPVVDGITFSVLSGEGSGQLTLVDMSGAIVNQILVNNGKAFMPVHHLNNGAYIATFTDNTGISISRKLLIQN